MPEIGRLEAKNTPIIIQTLRKTHQKKKMTSRRGYIRRELKKDSLDLKI